jgi:hypothetical protein
VSERIDNLKLLVEKSEKCRAKHLSSSPVREYFAEGAKKPIWEGVVETFQLENHPNGIKRAYAWQGWRDEEKKEPEYKVVLGVPPVNSPEDAIKVAVVGEVRKLIRETENRLGNG